MSPKNLGVLLGVCSFILPATAAHLVFAQRQDSNPKRPVTVADSIRMTRLANPDYIGGASAKPKVAEFSPDGKRFVVVLRKGNLENNTNKYSLVLFRTADALGAPSPEVLLTLASSSNRPAIQNVGWLSDNETLVFLGERPGESHQVYVFNCKTKKLKKLTNHPTNVLAYSMAKQGEAFAFIAEKSVQGGWAEKFQRTGIRVTTQRIYDLLAGEDRESHEDDELFVKSPRSRVAQRLEIDARLISWGRLSISPDGRYLVVMTRPRRLPESWREYKDELLQTLLPSGGAQRLMQYTLVDNRSGENQPVVEAPVDPRWGSEFVWAPDSHSLIVTGTYLPLEVSDVTEREFRRESPFVVEVRIPSREIVKLPNSDLRLIRWDDKTGKLLFQSGRKEALRGKDVPNVAYVWGGDAWRQTAPPVEIQDAIKVSLDEDLNTPPKIFVQDPKSGKRALLWDLNPQFASLNFARVEHIRWKATDGHDVDGGLYLPPNYVPGKKYPLILQTHGFNAQRFWIDGPWTTAFAAQALASKGFVVLQIPDWPDLDQWPKIVSTEREALYQMSSFEGAIDYVDGRGLIDRDRVGIIGFSRTCLYVKFALTQSKYKFAAAAIADGIDAGYLQYLAFSTASPGLKSTFEGLNKVSPFADGLSSWIKLSPGFGLHKVSTPLRIEALGRASLVGEWEWFAGLSLLGRPVELIYQPDADHIINKPWERLVSQQGNVDWFCFWLKGEEDPDPAKAEQYAHWRKVRVQQ